MSKRVCIDVGHGNNTYPPSKGIGDFAEFSFNNAVGKYAKALLEYNGFDVYLSQPFDSKEVPLNIRTKNINNEECDLVISIHANYNNNPDVTGHWGFYWHNSQDGLNLAKIWQKYANQILPNKDMGITPCKPNTWTNFAICRDTNMTAMLLEHAFYSNPMELKLLQDDGFIRQCAEVIVRTVCEYYNMPFKDLKKEDDNVEVLQWKYEGIEKLYELEILDDLEGWKNKIDEPMPTWAVTILLSKLVDKMK